jgi:hypothetical protein
MIGTPPRRTRFSIDFDRWYGGLSCLLALPPAAAYVDVGEHEVEVRMGWAFRSRFPRSAVRSISPSAHAPISRGVHGFGGRWLVNGSSRGLVTLALSPAQRAHVLGWPVSLRELSVSVADSAGLGAALAPANI